MSPLEGDEVDITAHYCYECEKEHPGPYVDREDIWHVPHGWTAPYLLPESEK